ncbi:MAG: DNA polymerase III subunit delta [Chitinophagales bacterium]|nr:MAG: DNA polymerase III subunit delta [Chitinophagales bacterium]
MTEYKKIIHDVKNKILHPIYLLHGEEPFFIDRVASYLEQHLLDEPEKTFNQTIIYGRDASYQLLIDALMRYPVMASQQLVILKEAQDFRELDRLQAYFENPMKSTVFVICYKYKTIDKRSRLFKLLSAKGVVMQSNKLYDNQVPAFIEEVAREMKLTLTPDAVTMMSEYIGNNLSQIVHELEKLKVGVGVQEPVQPDHVARLIGISREFNVFELTRALARRDKRQVFRIIKYFETHPKGNDPVMILAMLYAFFSKALVLQAENKTPEEMRGQLQIRSRFMEEDLKNYRKHYRPQEITKIMHLLHEYDLKIKGVDYAGTDKSVLLTELAYRILN